eukprot:scaffold541_cov23-Cyclotella_meneghiniana.AAC.2
MAVLSPVGKELDSALDTKDLQSAVKGNLTASNTLMQWTLSSLYHKYVLILHCALDTSQMLCCAMLSCGCCLIG